MKPNDFSFAKSRRFAPLFGTQFQGALNDNLFKTALFVMISYHGLGKNSILPPSQMLNLGALLFILPYFLFSSISGQLSTRYDKARFARIIKIWAWRPTVFISSRPYCFWPCCSAWARSPRCSGR